MYHVSAQGVDECVINVIIVVFCVSAFSFCLTLSICTVPSLIIAATPIDFKCC